MVSEKGGCKLFGNVGVIVQIFLGVTSFGVLVSNIITMLREFLSSPKGHGECGH